MSSSYSTLLQLELMASGEKNNTWGDITNGTLGFIEEAIAGMASITLASTNYTLSVNNGSADEARNAAIQCTGTLTADVAVVIPNKTKIYVFLNQTTGAYSVTVRTAAPSTSLVIPQGTISLLMCDGANNIYPVTSIKIQNDMDFGGFKLSDVILASPIGESLLNMGTLNDANTTYVTAGAITPDFNVSSHYYGVLGRNITVNTPLNPPAVDVLGFLSFEIKQASAAAYTVTFPAWNWPSNVPPTMTNTFSKTDIYIARTIDGGATYKPAIYGQGM